MSNVQLQVRPRRVRCTSACEPPPFRFTAGSANARPERSAATKAALVPVRAVGLAFATVGKVIDLAFFLVVLTVWNALHLTVWSYAFGIGPAADCFTLGCPTSWLDGKVLLIGLALAVTSYLLARFFRRLGHRATSFLLLVLVTFDVAALLLLGINALL